MEITTRDSAIMREAARLAAGGGQLRTADIISLLQDPHRPADVDAVLQQFDRQLTPEGRSTLALDALVPLPPGVVNQRHEAFFQRHLLTGRTYTTAIGDVIPNELQYFNGEMAHVYGECTNVAAVDAALAGSGYRTVTLQYAGGRRHAAAQLWFSRFTDTTIGPYNAMFIVVAAVPDHEPAERGEIRADANGASSALVMFDGSFDAATGVYENRTRLFLLRLLDTTQVAIDVGRERMGTDKRAGAIELTRHGGRLRISVRDRFRRGVVDADLELAGEHASYLPQIAQAAATAGIRLPALPRGTESAYPAVARIGRAPVVSWFWRSDSIPQLQPVPAGAVIAHPGSEEGQMLLTWGFRPAVLGYIANVRGVITGLAETSRAEPSAGSSGTSAASTGAARDSAGAAVYGRADHRPAVPTPGAPRQPGKVALLRAVSPGTGVASGALPVLRFVSRDTPLADARPPEAVRADAAVAPRYGWDTSFLGSLTAWLRKEVVGVTPDGLRINWHVIQGSFVGPGLDATVLPGAADWMRIRRDGVAIVNVQACFETRDGARVFGSYGGIFDLGPDGYARALRDEYDPLPPVVVTPTYATADPRIGWLNRAQCVGVGRVDMSELRVEFDVYVVRVGGRTLQGGHHRHTSAPPARPEGSLYQRLGGHEVIVALTDDFVSGVLSDRQLARFFPGPLHAGLRERVIDLLCHLTGGPCAYTGRDMKTAHQGMGITERDWTIAVDLFTAALKRRHLGSREQSEFLEIIQGMKRDIVEAP